VLDIAMPVMDGLTMCRRVREVSADVPIIMLTALTSESDIVAGLDAGADEYIAKPFRRHEFLARIRAVFRRSKLKAQLPPLMYKNDRLEIDLAARLVRVDGQEVSLTPTEFRLLQVLLQNIGQAVSNKQILEQVWGKEYLGDTDYPRTYIWHLRLKIEPDPKHPVYVLNEPGMGYRFVEHQLKA
jgi:two-component system KDP operon response regulator KdpE